MDFRSPLINPDNVETSERFVSASSVQGFSNAFSLMLACRPITFSGNTFDVCCVQIGTVGGANGIAIRRTPTDAAQRGYRIRITDSTGLLNKNYLYDYMMNFHYWEYLILTWDGASAILYKNGEALTPSSMVTNDGGMTLTDTARVLRYAHNTGDPHGFRGNIHSAAIWNVALSAPAITDLYGDGAIHLRPNVAKGNYTSQANLIRWYRFGADKSSAVNMGVDYVGSLDLTPTDVAPDDIETGVQNSPYPRRYAPSAGLGKSLRFAGNHPTNPGYARMDSDVDLGIANAWTVGVWERWCFRADLAGADYVLWDLKHDTNSNNRIRMLYENAATDRLALEAHDSGGTVRKQYHYTGIVQGLWVFWTAVWNGTTLILYRNGVDLTGDGAFNKFLDTSLGTMTNTTRRISLGIGEGLTVPSFDGTQHQLAIWSAALSSGAVGSLYNGGAPENLDLNGAFGSYSSASALEWWFKYGSDPTDLTKNYASSPPSTPTFTLTGLNRYNLVQDFPSSGYQPRFLI